VLLAIISGPLESRSLTPERGCSYGLSADASPIRRSLTRPARPRLHLAISVFSGILFGPRASLQLSRPDVNTALRDESRGSTGGASRNRARAALVIGQVALSMVLLVGSGLLIRSFIRIRNASPGSIEESAHHAMNLPPAKNSTAFYKNVLERVQILPGVESAAISTALPVAGTMARRSVRRTARPSARPTPDRQHPADQS